MNYAARNTKGLKTAMFAEVAILGIAIWQFYRFVTFRDPQGLLESNGGYGHLWLALSLALLACVTGFFIFSVFLRRGREDELHITSPH